MAYDSINLNLNPALDALNLNTQVSDHLEKKAERLLDQMKEISNEHSNISILQRELNIQIEKDYKGVIEKVDFTDNETIKEIINHLFEKGIIDEKKYVYENEKEIEFLRSTLDGYSNELKNKNQTPMILLQPLLNLIDMFSKITKTIIDEDPRLKEKTQSNT
jgi:hypothetical protein